MSSEPVLRPEAQLAIADLPARRSLPELIATWDIDPQDGSAVEVLLEEFFDLN